MKSFLLAALALAASPATAAVQLINAGLTVSTYGYIGDPSQAEVIGADDSTFSLRVLTAETGMIFQGAGTDDTLELDYAATVDMRNSSRISLSANSGMTFDIATPGPVTSYGQAGANFYYNFRLDRPTSLTIDYAITKAINPLPSFGIYGDPARIFIYDSGGYPPLLEFTAGTNSRGRFTATLSSGRYQLGLLTVLNDFAPPPPVFGAASGVTRLTGTDRFDIMFGSVPEPGSWAMMVAGFGLIGAVGRRKAKARFSAA